jgi:predicted N-acetyltransferase YhbS
MLPGPFERDRLLAVEFQDGALDGAEGMIVPTGAALSKRRVVRPLQAHAA